MQPELDLRKHWLKSPGGTAVRDDRYSKSCRRATGEAKAKAFLPEFSLSHYGTKIQKAWSQLGSVKQQRATDGLTLSYQEQPVSFELPTIEKRSTVHKMLR